MDYQKAYEILAKGVASALIQLDKEQDKSLKAIKARIILRSVQRQAEALGESKEAAEGTARPEGQA